jgi:hypothetical protein
MGFFEVVPHLAKILRRIKQTADLIIEEAPDLTPIPISLPARLAIYICLAGMFFLGMFPAPMVDLAACAVRALKP